MVYNFNFALKDSFSRRTIDLRNYISVIQATANTYNIICSKVKNKKHIKIVVYANYLEITLLSQKALNTKYVGIALRLFSQILVQQYGFIRWCTNSNPKKLFVTI